MNIVIALIFAGLAVLFVLTLDNAARDRKRASKYIDSSGWLKIAASKAVPAGQRKPVRWATQPGYHPECKECPYRAMVGDECGIAYECEAPDGCPDKVEPSFDYYNE